MARNKYYYNSVTCKYEEVEANPKKVLLSIGLFLLGVIVVSAGLIGIGYRYEIFQTRKMIELKRKMMYLEHMHAVLDARLAKTEKIASRVEYSDKEILRSIFDNQVDSIPETVRTAGIGGSEINYDDIIYNQGKSKILIKEKIRRLNALDSKLKIQIISHKELEKAAKKYGSLLASKPAIQPIRNKELTRLASGFGWRIHPILGVKKFHYGIDFTAKRGTPIYATGDGVVSKVKTSLGGYGKEVEINHGFGFITKYAHLQKFNVKLKDKVKRGDIIGEVGSTGSSTAPHLHYEIIKNGEKVNPVYYFFKDLNDKQFEEILRLASIENKSLS